MMLPADLTSASDAPASTLVVIPTYNEVENIGAAIEGVLACSVPSDVLVVDDASPDGTADVVVTAAARHPGRVHLLSRERKDGFAGAYRAGFEWAIARGYSFIAQMDADGSHPADRLAALVAEVSTGRADVAAGSRYVDGGSCVGWGVGRRVLSRGGNAYARLMLGLRCRDVTGGYRAWRREALVAVQPASTTSVGYGFQLELAARTQRCGFLTTEVPITFVDRQKGSSKMSRRIALEALFIVVRLRRAMADTPSAEPRVALAS